MSEVVASAESLVRLVGLLREVERVARERHDGHYTVLKFTTGYKAMWGTPDLYGGQQHPSEAPYWDVYALPAYPDLASALAGLLEDAAG